MGNLTQGGAAILISYIVFNVLAIMAVTLRFASISVRSAKIRVHDWLCVISLITCIGYSVDTFIGVAEGGIGEHMGTLSMPQLVIALKTFWASQFLWAVSIASFRISILILYTTLFVRKEFLYSAYACMVVVVLFFIASISVTLRLCKPVSFNWDKLNPAGKCGDTATAEMSAAAFNLVLDIIFVALPLPVVWGLNMSKQKKAGITAVLALGLSISGVNLGRIIQIKVCSLSDFTYCTKVAAILTVAEMALGIITACAPTLGPIFFRREAASQNRYRPPPAQSDQRDSHKMRLLKGSTNHSKNIYRQFDTEISSKSARSGQTEPDMDATIKTDILNGTYNDEFDPSSYR